MDFFKKLKPSKEESWGVILRGVPNKKVEEALIRIFTERLDVPGNDALKIIHSSPIILFGDRSARDAEKIKLILNKTGARTAISNDPADFRTLARVAWPKQIEVSALGDEDEIPVPVTPPAPKIPPPSPVPPGRPHVPLTLPVKDEWKTKYENLNQIHASVVEGLEKKKLELNKALEKIQEFQTQLKILTEKREGAVRERDDMKGRLSGLERDLLNLKGLQDTFKGEKEKLVQEKEQVQKALEEVRKELLQSQRIQESLQSEKIIAVSARQQAEKALEEIRKELIRSQEIRESLQREINLLRLEKERSIPEIEKIKATLESQIESAQKQTESLKSQLKFFDNLLEVLKKSSRPLGSNPKPESSSAPPPIPITPLKRPGTKGGGSKPIGIIPPSST